MRYYQQDSIEIWRKRLNWALVAVTVAFFILLLKLWDLQVMKGDIFRKFSEQNRLRLEKIPAFRGMILDRNGRLLVDNHPSFSAYVARENLKDKDRTLKLLAKFINMEVEEIEKKLEKYKDIPLFEPVLIKKNLSRDEVVLLESYRLELPGIMVQVRPKRSYLYGSLASHLLGYLGEIGPKELEKRREDGYKLGDFIGKSGVERAWESFLKGKDGGRLVQVDATGRMVNLSFDEEVKFPKEIPPTPGMNVILSLDLELQEEAEKALADKVGAIVAMDPKNGRILAMVSHPNFNPNIISNGIQADEWKSLLEDPFHPLENRVIRGQYNPGSTFKIITAIAALEKGIIDAKTKFYCNGKYTFKGKSFYCWKKSGHGSVDLYQALVQSCNVYFYQLGIMVGIDNLAHYAYLFGLGKLTGIPLEGEKAGIIPSTRWKKSRYGIPWYAGETISTSIGQGYILVTPLQMAQFISALVNGGMIFQPQLVLRVEDPYGKIVKEYRPKMLRKISISQENLEIIKKALIGVVNDPKGTGKKAKIEGITVGGKTGTVQVAKIKDHYSNSMDLELPYELRDHAWFVGFAPAEDPQIVLVVFVEHGGSGGTVAAPIAGQILKKYFQKVQNGKVDKNDQSRQKINP